MNRETGNTSSADESDQLRPSTETLHTSIMSSIFSLPLKVKMEFGSSREMSHNLFQFSLHEVGLLPIKKAINAIDSSIIQPDLPPTILLVKNKKIVLHSINKLYIYDVEEKTKPHNITEWCIYLCNYVIKVASSKEILLITENRDEYSLLTISYFDKNMPVRRINLQDIIISAFSVVEPNDIYLSVYSKKLREQFIVKFSNLGDIDKLDKHFFNEKYVKKAKPLENTFELFAFQIISYTETSLKIWAIVHQAEVIKCTHTKKKENYSHNWNIFDKFLEDARAAQTTSCILVELMLNKESPNVPGKARPLACDKYTNPCYLCETMHPECNCENKKDRHPLDQHAINSINLNGRSCLAFNGVDVVFISDYIDHAVHQFLVDGTYVGRCLDPQNSITNPVYVAFDDGQLFVAEVDQVRTFTLGKLNSSISSSGCLDHVYHKLML